MKKIILFCFVWTFFIWLSIYFLKQNFLEMETEKGQLLAKNEATRNKYALQNQLETLLNVEGSNAVVLDPHGKILVPFSQYGRHFSSSKKHFFTEPILSDQKEILGKIFLEYRPHSPNFLFLIGAVFLPPLLVLGIWYLLREKARLQKKAEIKKEEQFEWIGALKKLGLGAIFCFDETGKILASSEGTENKHVLDIFSDPEEARAILTNSSQHPTSCWENIYGEKRFFVILP